MATTPVQHLFDAVRRHLWRGQFVTAVRRALWSSVGLMLLAVAVHLAVRAAAAGVVLSALAVLWTAMLAWAAGRRPTDAACALWADLHLGGASAFTTLLDTGRRQAPTVNAQAVHWLERWATARVPDFLRLLARRHEPWRLSRPLACAAVSAALATLVLTLPDPAPVQRQRAAAPPASGLADAPLNTAETPASAQLVSELAGALRAAAAHETPELRSGSQAPAAGPVRTDEGDAPQSVPSAATPAGGREAGRDAATGTAAVAGPKTGNPAGTGSGRQAGDSRDDRADVGVSQASRGTMTVQRSASDPRSSAAEKQVDLERAAAYDDRLPMQAAPAWQAAPVAAATPPAAVESARLAPTEATYVQAWMKASAGRR